MCGDSSEGLHGGWLVNFNLANGIYTFLPIGGLDVGSLQFGLIICTLQLTLMALIHFPQMV